MRTGRKVVVTGAAGGMGAALVDRFLSNGDTVVAADINEAMLAELRDEHGGRPELATVVTDISREEDCESLSAFVRANSGRVDVLVNCAGYYPIVNFEDMTAAQWRQVIDINLTGHFLIIHAMLPLMTSGAWGRIITYGSSSVLKGVAGQTHYVAAKAGIIGLTRSLARELGHYGITVNVVAPGLTLTEPVRRSFSAESLDKERRARPLNRDERAEDLVGPVFFLASPDADFMTGQMVNVDGGSNMY